MHVRRNRRHLVGVALICVQSFADVFVSSATLLCSVSIAKAQAAPFLCPKIDDATPGEHLDRAIKDHAYGACLSKYATDLHAECGAAPAPAKDMRAAADHRMCGQLSITYEDLAVNFRPDAGYRRVVADCAASGASIPCDEKASVEKDMRCRVAMLSGASTEGCLPALPAPPGKK